MCHYEISVGVLVVIHKCESIHKISVLNVFKCLLELEKKFQFTIDRILNWVYSIVFFGSSASELSIFNCIFRNGNMCGDFVCRRWRAQRAAQLVRYNAARRKSRNDASAKLAQLVTVFGVWGLCCRVSVRKGLFEVFAGSNLMRKFSRVTATTSSHGRTVRQRTLDNFCRVPSIVRACVFVYVWIRWGVG